jgi:hypothetical protein
MKFLTRKGAIGTSVIIVFDGYALGCTIRNAPVSVRGRHDDRGAPVPVVMGLILNPGFARTTTNRAHQSTQFLDQAHRRQSLATGGVLGAAKTIFNFDVSGALCNRQFRALQ